MILDRPARRFATSTWTRAAPISGSAGARVTRWTRACKPPSQWYANFLGAATKVSRRLPDDVYGSSRSAARYVVEPEPRADERGFFARLWCRDEFDARRPVGGLRPVQRIFSAHKGHTARDALSGIALRRDQARPMYPRAGLRRRDRSPAAVRDIQTVVRHRADCRQPKDAVRARRLRSMGI